MQTIVQDLPIAVQQSHEDALAGLPSTEQVKELMLLYQLCIKLLGCGDPNRVVDDRARLAAKSEPERRSSDFSPSTTKAACNRSS